jgi:hypothetical protein
MQTREHADKTQIWLCLRFADAHLLSDSISASAVAIVDPPAPTVSEIWRQRSPKRSACRVSAALGGSSRAATTTTVLERPPRDSPATSRHKQETPRAATTSRNASTKTHAEEHKVRIRRGQAKSKYPGAADTETATSSVRAEPKETEMKSVLKTGNGKRGDERKGIVRSSSVSLLSENGT